MSQFLKADTAVKVTIGPVVAVGDGFTPVITLTLAAADEAEIIKHNTSSTSSISGNTITAITDADGYYAIDLTAGNLDTEGQLTLLVNDDSLCLPVKAIFMVVPANVFDSLFAVAGTDVLDVNVTQWLGVAAPSFVTAGDVSKEIGLVVSGHGLDHLLLQSVAGIDVTDNSIFAKLVSKEATADWDDYVNTTDSLQAIRDRGDAEWIGGGGLTTGDINAQVGLVVSGHGLDHLILKSVTGTDITDDSIFARLVSKSGTADWDDFINTTDSLQAIRDQGDAAWIGGGGLTTGDINREVGLVVSGHGLDHLLLQSVTGTDVTDDSLFAKLVSASATADWDDYINTTDSLEAIRDVEPHGTVMRGTDSANTVVPDAAGVLPTAVEIRTEMDSNSTELAKIGTIPALDGAGQNIGAALAKLADDNGGADFDATTDSLQAIRDQGDSAWITAVGFSTLSFGEINREMGLVVSGHGLDNFVFTTSNKVDARIDYIGANPVTTPDDFKADVTNLDVAISTVATPAQVNTQVGLVVSGHGLDHLLLQAVAGTDITDDSIFAKLVSASATADWDSYDNTDDSLEAIRNRGDAAWIGGGGLTSGDISREIGLVVSGHGLDHLLLQSVTGTDVTDDSIIAMLVSASATADWDDYVNTSDSLQAIRDVEPHGTVMRGTDGANTTVPDAAGVLPTAVEIRTEMDSNSTQLSTIAGDVVNLDGDSMRGTDSAYTGTPPTTGDINTEVGLVVSGHGLDNFVFTTSNKVDARVDYVGANSVTTPNDFKADVSNLDVAISSRTDSGEINREIGLVVSGHGLDHLLLQAVVGADITDNSIFAKLVSKEATADWDDFNNTTDSLQSIRDQGDSAWITAAGFSTLSFNEVNREIGLVVSGHGLDHLLATSVTGTDVIDDSIIAMLVSASATADWDDFVNTTDSLQALRDNLATPADVNTQVLDVVNTDTFAEPAQGTPPATTTLVTKINYLYKYLRNRLTVTSGTISVYNDDGTTVDHKSTHSDDGTTYDRGEFITGA